MSWKYQDFKCSTCQHEFEDLVKSEDLPDPCPKCGNATKFTRIKRIHTLAVITQFVVDVPGSKRMKAGYQHSHNRAAEKAGSQVSMVPSKKR